MILTDTSKNNVPECTRQTSNWDYLEKHPILNLPLPALSQIPNKKNPYIQLPGMRSTDQGA